MCFSPPLDEWCSLAACPSGEVHHSPSSTSAMSFGSGGSEASCWVGTGTSAGDRRVITLVIMGVKQEREKEREREGGGDERG